MHSPFAWPSLLRLSAEPTFRVGSVAVGTFCVAVDVELGVTADLLAPTLVAGPIGLAFLATRLDRGWSNDTLYLALIRLLGRCLHVMWDRVLIVLGVRVVVWMVLTLSVSSCGQVRDCCLWGMVGVRHAMLVVVVLGRPSCCMKLCIQVKVVAMGLVLRLMVGADTVARLRSRG